MHTAYLSLGSNMGDREANLREAIVRLGEAGVVTKTSSFYETKPVEVTEQPWFLNAALALQTSLRPDALLRKLLEIERAMGRERNVNKGPRNIDLDLLLFDNEILETDELSLPHPAMHARRFVLVPLAEIAPDVTHPIVQKTVAEMLVALRAEDAVRRVAHQE